jgi:aspartyl-tRNA(Asn)/glutamyl-tRNA(Gln) amidotransferase subunit A
LACSSIGTQTCGSIVNPSNQQNLTGLKPTMGRTSIYGVIPLSYTRDHSGPLARDALDTAIMLSVMAGPDGDDVRTLDPPVPDLITSALPVRRGGQVVLRRPTTIGVPPDYFTGVSSSVAALRTAFLDTLASIPGAKLVEVAYPDDWNLMTGTFNNVRLSERAEPFLPYLKHDPKLFGVSLLSWLQGCSCPATNGSPGSEPRTISCERSLTGLWPAVTCSCRPARFLSTFWACPN